MKFENTEIWGFKHALRGMRNPMNSWGKSDSQFGFCREDSLKDVVVDWYIKIFGHKPQGLDWHLVDTMDFIITNKDKKSDIVEYAIIGENDMKLAQKLIRAGSEHRKFMRQIFVSVDITAPLYWWKEFDTYKVGTTANSTSTMHKLATTPITLECFEIDDLISREQAHGIEFELADRVDKAIKENLIGFLESLRQLYLKTKNKKHWKELIRWLPESWLQTRTVTMSYENLYSICHQRESHKLNEWSGKDYPELPNFIAWARTLPYAKELIFGDEG